MSTDIQQALLHHHQFCFPRDQYPFLSTFVIQQLYLFADRKLKTWLYYMNIHGKLFTLHGVGWYKLCGMFRDLLMARRDVQRVVRVAGLLCYPASVKETWTGSERLEEFSTRVKSALHL